MTADAAPNDLIELGVVRGAYGVKGWIRIALHAKESSVLMSTNTWWLQSAQTAQPVNVTAARRHGAVLLAQLDGCDSKEAADALKGQRVAVARAEFPAALPGEVYWADLIGARVVNRAGIDLGQISAIRNNGAHDLLELGSAGSTLLIPLLDPFIDEIDVEARIVRVDWGIDW